MPDFNVVDPSHKIVFSCMKKDKGASLGRIEVLSHDIEACKKNSHFYTHKTLVYIGLTVAVVAAVVIATYFITGLISPLVIQQLALIGTGRASGMVIGALVLPVFFPALAGFGLLGACNPLEQIGRNQESDQRELGILTNMH